MKKDDFETHVKAIQPIYERVTELQSKNLYIEAFILVSSVIERLLQESLVFHERWIERLVSAKNQRFEVTDIHNHKKPLGILISRYKKISNDQKSVDLLNDFNGARRQILHNLLEKPLANNNSFAKKKIEVGLFLMAVLTHSTIVILNKTAKSHKREVKSLKSKVKEYRDRVNLKQ